jgi:hypothetical protein
MDPVIAARNELEPLLAALIQQLNSDGRATPRAIYKHIHASLTQARTEMELTIPFNELSTSASMFELSAEATVLLGRIVKKTEWLASERRDIICVTH